MDALEALTSRVSAARLIEPAPDDVMLATYFKAAHRAPDHGRLRPWRFIVIRGEARHKFSAVLVDALLKRDPAASPAKLKKKGAKSLRAPMIIVVAAKIFDGNIPPLEQLLAAGAAAQNILVAAHATGFGAVWKTGAPAYDLGVKTALGLDAADEIVGFIYLGTPAASPTIPEGEDPQDFVREWTGVGA